MILSEYNPGVILELVKKIIFKLKVSLNLNELVDFITSLTTALN